MSKGAGVVEQKLRAIFARDPRDTFTTTELCEAAYPGKKVQKKHRVSVLRAIKRLASRSMPWIWRRVRRFARDDEWFDARFYHPGNARDRAPATKRRPLKRWAGN